MNITLAQWWDDPESGQAKTAIIATIDGQEMAVSAQAGNRHYDEIMRQVEAGDLTIADAD